jgi:hypothetical protein
MQVALARRRSAIALAEAKNVDDIPTYRARVPLQSAVQLLKYHRDVMFADDSEDKPISIIITTLAARSYNNELDVTDALRVILRDMDSHIEQQQGVDWIPNPTNGLENFADRWIQYPRRRENFHKWLKAVREDFDRIARAAKSADAELLLEQTFGPEVAERVRARRSGGMLKRVINQSKLRLLSLAGHRQTPPWTQDATGSVTIYRATKHESGFRPVPMSSDSVPVRKGAELRFYARTDVPGPYQVYWQVVNTGEEAERDRGLRGGFDTGSIHSGKLVRKEPTKYKGTHSIECFVVKNGYLAARSGQFIVNVQ